LLSRPREEDATPNADEEEEEPDKEIEEYVGCRSQSQLSPAPALICVVVYLTHRDHGHNSTKAAKEEDEEVERYVVPDTDKEQGWPWYLSQPTYLMLLRLQ
jgi:hypothetical protein